MGRKKTVDPEIQGWFRFTTWNDSRYDFPYWRQELTRQGRRWKLVHKANRVALYVRGHEYVGRQEQP